MRRKNLINDVDVIEYSHRVVPRFLLCHRIHFGKLNKELIVGPRFVFEEGVKQGGCAHDGLAKKRVVMVAAAPCD